MTKKMDALKDKLDKEKDKVMGDGKDDKGGFPFKKKKGKGKKDKDDKGGFPFKKKKGEDDDEGDDGDCCESHRPFKKFGQWLEIREGKQDGLPNSPTGSKSCGGRDKARAPSGVKSHVDDLSGDYKGHLSHNGTVEPWKKMKGKGGKSVAPVAK